MNVVITGGGLWTAAGRGVDATIDALRRGRSGLGTLSLFESERCAPFPVAEVETDGMVGSTVSRTESRTTTLAEVAARDAWIMSGLPQGGVDRSRMGLALGICVGGLFESEPEVARCVRGEEPDDAVWLRHEAGDTTSRLARRLDLGGPSLTVSTACTSGAKAIALGAELIDDGLAEVVIAGGVDALTRLTFHGFLSLLAVDPEGCRPFDRRRQGMSLGEGAGFVVLESESHAARRGATPLVRLAGYGHSCDAYHPTAPQPEGRGAEAAIRAALADAGVAPDEVDYINAHGTGTPDNDRAESAAMRAVYGDRMPPFSSTKRVFGHTLGAAGGIEAVVCALAIDRGFLPGTVGYQEADEETLVPLARTEDGSPTVVMSHSFGFGGNNTVLCFSRPDVTGSRSTSLSEPAVDRRGVTGSSTSPRDGWRTAFPVHGYAVSGLDLGATGRSGDGSLPSVFERLDPSALARLEESSVPFPAAGAHRRKARLPDHAAALAKAALGDAPLGGEVDLGPGGSVHWGTALGGLTETTAFLENLFEHDGGAPKPRAFTSSVHNAIASRIAQSLNAQGDNETFVHGEVSAVLAAWAVQRGYRRDRARDDATWIHGALDEHSEYVDRARRYCDREASERSPDPRPGGREGGALFVTRRDSAVPELARLAVRFARPGDPDQWVAEQAEAFGVEELWLSGTWHPARRSMGRADRARGAVARWSTGVDPDGWGAPTFDVRSVAGRHPSAGASAVAVAIEARRAERVGVVTISRFGDLGFVAVRPAAKEDA